MVSFDWILFQKAGTETAGEGIYWQCPFKNEIKNFEQLHKSFSNQHCQWYRVVLLRDVNDTTNVTSELLHMRISPRNSNHIRKIFQLKRFTRMCYNWENQGKNLMKLFL